MFEPALELPGGVKTTKNVPLDPWRGPYTSITEAMGAVPAVMRPYRTIEIIEAGFAVEYQWGTDSSVQPTKKVTGGGVTDSFDFDEFTANKTYPPRTIVNDFYFTMGFIPALTTGAKLSDTWNAGAVTGDVAFIGRLPIQNLDFYSDFLPGQAAPAMSTALYNDSDILEFFFFQGGRHYNLKFYPMLAYSYRDLPVTVRFDIAAGSRISGWDFTDPVFIGPVPVIADKTYATHTIIELQFVVEMRDNAIRWRWVPTSGSTSDYLQSLPGYGDPAKPYLMKDANGFFYWGAGDVAPGTNQAPNYTQIAAISFAQDAPSYQVNLANYFTDPNGDALVYSVQSLGANPTLVSYEDLDASGVLILYPNAAGSTTITVRATDAGGLYAQQSFGVTVVPSGDTYAESGYVETGYSD